MKIKFDNISYEIIDYRINLDSDNNPMDIVLYGDINTLFTIAENHGILGFNYHENFPYSEALYGILDPFIIEK